MLCCRGGGKSSLKHFAADDEPGRSQLELRGLVTEADDESPRELRRPPCPPEDRRKAAGNGS
jgi:hypothetical protein